MKYIYILMFTALSVLTSCKQDNSEEIVSATFEELYGQFIDGNNRTIYPLKFNSYDPDGNLLTQKIDKVPERVITTSLSSLEMLLELGLKDKIVGITEPDNRVIGEWSDTIYGLNILGDKITLAQETMLSYKPDLIIGPARGFMEQYQGTIKRFNQLGVAIATQMASVPQIDPTLRTIIDDIKMFGLIFDKNIEAQNYADSVQLVYNNILDQTDKNRKMGEKDKRVMVMAGFNAEKGIYSSFTVSSGRQLDLVRTLNLQPAFEGGTTNSGYENLLQINPDIIIYIKIDRYKQQDRIALESLYNNELLKSIPAIKDRAIFITTYDDFMDCGVRNFAVLQQFSQFLFANKDLQL